MVFGGGQRLDEAIEGQDWHLALRLLNEAIASGGSSTQLYEKRSIVHEKLGLFREAYLDAKKVASMSPLKVQNVARVSRLLMLLTTKKSGDIATGPLHQEASVPSSPIDSLPTEVLVDIFTHYSRGTMHFALLSVCRRWKEIIISDPRFWKILSINQMVPSMKDLRMWIGLYRGHVETLRLAPPVTSKLASFIFAELSKGPKCQPLIALGICQHHIPVLKKSGYNLISPDRLASLECYKSYDTAIRRKGSQRAGSVSQDPEVKLVPWQELLPRSSDNQTAVLSSLEQFFLCWPSGPSRWPSMPRLRKLDIRLSSRHVPLDPSEFHDIVRSCSETLQSFSLRMYGHALALQGNAPMDDRGPIVLPNLTDLELTIYGDTQYPAVLSYLKMPNLKHLSLSEFAGPVTNYLGAISTSLEEVTWLFVESTIFNETAFMNSLLLMPKLNYLALRERGDSPIKKIIATLAKPRNNGEFLLPHLRHLDVSNSENVGKACLSLVRLRNRPGIAPGAGTSSSVKSSRAPAPIQSLVIDLCESNAGFIPRLEKEVPHFVARRSDDKLSVPPVMDMYAALDVLDCQNQSGQLFKANFI